MDWKDVEERLIERIGVNYHNYPKSVEWNIKVMRYLDKNRKEKTSIPKTKENLKTGSTMDIKV